MSNVPNQITHFNLIILIPQSARRILLVTFTTQMLEARFFSSNLEIGDRYWISLSLQQGWVVPLLRVIQCIENQYDRPSTYVLQPCESLPVQMPFVSLSCTISHFISKPTIGFPIT